MKIIKTWWSVVRDTAMTVGVLGNALVATVEHDAYRMSATGVLLLLWRLA